MKLKPCPFCGKRKPVIVDSKENSFGEICYFGSCSLYSNGCGAHGEQDTKELGAAKKWNRRAK